MTKTRNIVLAGFILSSILPSLAAAQSSCDCSTVSEAEVTFLNGGVTSTNFSGIGPTQLGQTFTQGAEIYTEIDGVSNISFGPDCNVRLDAQKKGTFVHVQQGAPEICLREESLGSVTQSSNAVGGLGAGGAFSGYVAAGIGALIAGGAVIALGETGTGGGSGGFKEADPVSGAGGGPI